jgi:hypothetical protein
MNTIRTIEGATLLSIGIFCTSAMINIALHGNGLSPNATPQVNQPVLSVPTITVSAHRLSASERAQALQEQNAASDVLAVDHSGNVGVVHAG